MCMSLEEELCGSCSHFKTFAQVAEVPPIKAHALLPYEI